MYFDGVIIEWGAATIFANSGVLFSHIICRRQQQIGRTNTTRLKINHRLTTLLFIYFLFFFTVSYADGIF